MPENSIKAQLIDLLKAGRVFEQQWLAELSDADRAADGLADKWAVKDVFAHLFYWRGHTVQRLAAALSGETPIAADDFERLNRENFEVQRQRSWAELVAEEARIYQELVALIGKISEEDLTTPDRFAWQRGSLARSVLGNGYEHPLLHVAQAYAEAGQQLRANQIQEEAAAQLMRFPEMQSAAHYNLACFYALNGQPQKALNKLREALQTNPALRDWSRQDADLNSLHGDSEYEALYQ